MAGLLAYIGAGALAGASQGAQQALTNSTQWGGWWNVQRLENQKIAWENKAKQIEYQNLVNLETLFKQPWESKQKALDRATTIRAAELGVEGEKARGENAAREHALSQMAIHQGEMGLRQFLQGQALAAQHDIAQMHDTTQTGIADQDRASRDLNAAQDRLNKIDIVNKQIAADKLKTSAQIQAELDKLNLGYLYKMWDTQDNLAAKGALVHNVVTDDKGFLRAVHNDGTSSPIMIDDQPVRAPKQMTDQQKILAQYYLNQIKSNNALLAKEDDPTDIDTLNHNDLVFKRQLFGLLGGKPVTPSVVDPFTPQPTGQIDTQQDTSAAPGPGPAAPAAPAAPVAPTPLGGSFLNRVQ